jgi:hypothetical protein
VQEARALARRRLAPRSGERGARRLDGAVDVGLAGIRDARERLAGRGLREIARLAGSRLGALAADEEAAGTLASFPRRFGGHRVAMDEVQVEAARIPDRDRLLEELRESGLDARPVNEVGIEVSTGDDEEVFAHVERMIMSIGAPFVPLQHDGVIYIRPPLS